MAFFSKNVLALVGSIPFWIMGMTQVHAETMQESGLSTPSHEQVMIMRRDTEAILHYKLAPDVLPRLTATLQAIQKAGIRPPDHYGMSLDEQIRLVEKVKGLDRILRAHGFTARDFVTSLTCVGMTGSMMNALADQRNDSMKPDPENVALLRNNPQALHDLDQVVRAEKTMK